MENGCFKKLTNLITAKHVQFPIANKVDATWLLDRDIFISLTEPEEGIESLVFREDQLVGVVNYDKLWEACVDDRILNVPLDHIAKPLLPEQIIASNTAVIELPQLFTNKGVDFFFVLDGAEISGTVHYWALFYEGLFRLCLLARTFELEERVSHLIRSSLSEEQEKLWRLLPENHRKVIQKRCNDWTGNGRDAPVSQLLTFSSFWHKVHIVKNSNLLQERAKIYLAPEVDIITTLDTAVKIRNSCAHADPEYETGLLELFKDPARLSQWLSKSENLTQGWRELPYLFL